MASSHTNITTIAIVAGTVCGLVSLVTLVLCGILLYRKRRAHNCKPPSPSYQRHRADTACRETQVRPDHGVHHRAVAALSSSACWSANASSRRIRTVTGRSIACSLPSASTSRPPPPPRYHARSLTPLCTRLIHSVAGTCCSRRFRSWRSSF